MTSTVPHTLLRNGIFYFNRRYPAGILRVSLRTNGRTQAMQRAGVLADFLNRVGRLNLKLEQLQQITA